ncbi:MAG: alcohol dehydrogenase class IV [Verrucomicrobiales bacterium]|jgi:alcohol dehydrogenase class IV
MHTQPKQQVVHLGIGALNEIASILTRLSARSVFLVADEPAYSASGAADELQQLLADRSVKVFTGFEPNPKLPDIERGIQPCRALNPDVVIAVGGGTAIDLAKLIGALSVCQGAARDIITGRRNLDTTGPPLIAIPTTAGTGSEATHFAVAYVDGRKYSVADPRLLPDYAVIDPRLTLNLPPRITAASGLDAFCQSVESIWAVGATDESIQHASESVQLAQKHLQTCVEQSTPASRLAMCQAAHLSGKAINISKTTAPHAISYAITSRYGTPHGMAVALTLGQMLQFNASVCDDDCVDPRGSGKVRSRIDLILKFLGRSNPKDGAEAIQCLMKSVGAPLRLRDVGIQTDEELAWIAEQVDVERLSNNPRNLAKPDLKRILAAIR